MDIHFKAINPNSDTEESKEHTQQHEQQADQSKSNYDPDRTNTLKALHQASQRALHRKCWDRSCLCDWFMHKLIFGKLIVLILTWTTIINYSKDLYVAYHFAMLNKWWEFIVTLCILFLSLRLMLYLRTIDIDNISLRKLFLFYLPGLGSVCVDMGIDRFSDVGVCLVWEIAVLLGTPFVPFLLIYLAIKKSVSLFCYSDKRLLESPYLLSYAVVECLFECIPQLGLQSYLYFYHNKTGEIEVELFVFIIAWIVSIFVLIKILIVVWYNWNIIYKLSFKRTHSSAITSIKYHPEYDLIATGSWDHTVLVNSIINNETVKAKRVFSHHYNINCVEFHKTESDIIAVAGHGVELFNWRKRKSVAKFPKITERDPLGRKIKVRTNEVKQVIFSPDGNSLIWCQGKNILIWDILTKTQLLEINCLQRKELGDVECIDMSPNGKYIACGFTCGHADGVIKVYDSHNKELIRVLKGHKDAVNCLKFDRDGKYIISGGSDGKMFVFDLKSGRKISEFNEHTSDITCIAIDYSNKYVASAGKDNLLHISYLNETNMDNIESVSLKNWIPYKTQRYIRCCDFSPYGDTIACGSEDDQVHILKLPHECHVNKSNTFSSECQSVSIIPKNIGEEKKEDELMYEKPEINIEVENSQQENVK